MKALYRRYRPKKLDEVVAQPQVTEPLIEALKSGKLGHAYLFVGPRGCGKTSVARILAHEINKFEYELEDDYLDIIEIDGASNTGVDNIRELRERAIVAPVEGKYKIYIIDEVHMLSKSAFNALLKTLEEPPEHVVFIMATTELNKVPATILSRCQKYQFKLAQEIEMLSHLKKITAAEKIKIDEDALKIIIARGGGSFRDTLSLLDQISTINSGNITADSVRDILGLPNEEIIDKLLEAYKTQDLTTIREQIQYLNENSIEPDLIAGELVNKIINSLDASLLPLIEPLSKIKGSSFPDAKLLLALATPSTTTPISATTVPTTVVTAPKSTATTKSTTPAPNPTITPEPKKSATTTTAPKTEPKPEPSSEPQPEPTPEPEKTPAPEPQKAPAARVKNTGNADELWNTILNHVAQNAKTIQRFVQDSSYTFENNVLKIYAGKKFNKLQIEKKRGIISEVLPTEIEIEITEEILRNDETLDSIAELMGGGEEVNITE